MNPCAQHSPVFQVLWGDLTVDLDERFPSLVPSDKASGSTCSGPRRRAPIFSNSPCEEYSVICLAGTLKNDAPFERGILGNIRAFFGTDEFTNRGQLHGHFVIWLDGAPNPDVIHKHLKLSNDYQEQFFSFFDSIIKHNLPSIECPDLFDPGYEPRMQRPIPPPQFKDVLMSEEDKALAMEAWVRTFLLDVKGCGEALQRHECQPVCHKYGNEGKCRFLFPHDIVESSYFDSESNSIMLSVRDPTVNYYNPYILVFCRHNHDLKCILSGKSAKSAMMYITDYITKMDLKTYQILAMLSKAVVGFSKDGSPVDVWDLILNDTKSLLHKCLSQFARQREIHAQQAVRLIRGFEGSWESHASTVMLSRALIAHVKRTYNLRLDEKPTAFANEASDDDDEEQQEQEDVRVDVDDSGTFIRTNQIWDYFLRDVPLSNVCFYEFVQRYKLVRKRPRSQGPKAMDRRVKQRFGLKSSHQLCNTHELQEIRRNERDGLIPRVYGCSVPRQSNEHQYWLFCLAHFKPFGIDDPLFEETCDLDTNSERSPFGPIKRSHGKLEHVV